MSIKSLIRNENLMPIGFDDLFKPWDSWFDDRFAKTLKMPAVNIIENGKEYKITVAVPGMKKEDLKIDVDGDVLTISSEKEENKEQKEEKYTRKEYSYTSFSRSFSLPDDVSKDKIDATYKDGVLNVSMPKREVVNKKGTQKSIAVK